MRASCCSVGYSDAAESDGVEIVGCFPQLLSPVAAAGRLQKEEADEPRWTTHNRQYRPVGTNEKGITDYGYYGDRMTRKGCST